jgi:hypothetical protein
VRQEVTMGYINNNIKLDKSKLPKIMTDFIDKLEEYDRVQDEVRYVMFFDDLEVTTKSLCDNGKLPWSVMEKVYKKYGGLG